MNYESDSPILPLVAKRRVRFVEFARTRHVKDPITKRSIGNALVVRQLTPLVRLRRRMALAAAGGA